MIGHRLDVEEARARNVRRGELGAGVAVAGREEGGAIDADQVALAEMRRDLRRSRACSMIPMRRARYTAGEATCSITARDSMARRMLRACSTTWACASALASAWATIT